nr:RNA polymerase, subunit H/Rpb5, conserved site-containing protein [Ipomoea batatas]
MSSSSASIPSGSFQSKWNSSLASGTSTLTSPNNIPGHILRPAPNGMNSKCFPRKSAEESRRNLSGSNDSAFSQCSESLPIAHAFTITLVLAGISRDCLTSACALSITCGFFIISDIAHSTTPDEVSVPAVNIS